MTILLAIFLLSLFNSGQFYACSGGSEHLNERYDLGIEESDEYDTLAGYIIAVYDGIPSSGTFIETEKLEIKVLRSTRTRIELARVKKR